MSNKVYDILKYCTLIIFPALITFAGVIMNSLNYVHTDIVLTISTAFVTCLGTCLGISNYNYQKNQNAQK